MSDTAIPEARIRWLLRRGMKELDIMVTRYYERDYASAPQAQRDTFLRLLTQVEDPDIWAWAMGYAPTPPEFADVIERLRIYS